MRLGDMRSVIYIIDSKIKLDRLISKQNLNYDLCNTVLISPNTIAVHILE